MKHAIKTVDLTKSFGGLVAVDHVSLEVDQAEIFGFLGPNGAGKTTTIRMLVTLLKPTSGSAEVWGHDILKERDEVRRSIGIVFQDPSLDGLLTGRENMDFHGRIYGISKARRQERIKELLDLAQLLERADDLVKTYSGGMKRRLEIARGLMHQPNILFLDEPTLGLDPQNRRVVWSYIQRLNKQEDVTIFLTTHYMEEADFLCDRVAIIDRGRIVALDTCNNLKERVGGDVVLLRISNANAKVLDAFREEEFVHDLKLVKGSLVFTVNDGERAVPQLIEVARHVGVSVEECSIRKPNLEDVFIHYTGRRIRDEFEKPESKAMRMGSRMTRQRRG
ncbi:ATP-binding cassette domain-containing protein [Candidatus Bathyarchaeota archaeon]|nr:ATP-binding cassette domain-containing protein [Candidatus Bathyarchaeota archaeon]